MIIDTSALLAILLDEPESEALVRAIVASRSRSVGAATLVEAAAVMRARKGDAGEVALDALLERLSIDTRPLSADAAAVARQAYRRFGKGVGSPGVLDYGDCLAYGTAVAVGEPLLFKGDDFARTDIAAAPY